MKDFVCVSEPMRECLRLAGRVAETSAGVLITGESGTGKNRLARFVHHNSARRNATFVEIDCAALPSDLIEAELFGYERGAFTGAVAAKPGRFEAAHKGTLVLDEIAYLPIESQAKLLRVIERGEFERLGARRTVRLDARLIALTNVDLEAAVNRGAFRADLFYRLNVVHIRVPPLRERGEDVGFLAEEFLRQLAAKHGQTASKFAPEALSILKEYEFPGNVRELANTVERAVVLAEGDRVEEKDLPQNVRAAAKLKARDGRPTLAELEADYIAEVLAFVRGNKSEAARVLGISRKNLYEKIKRYRIEV
ncbi:MAG: sigma-54-dependent Fis family transcriptional regulator [Pyrinomonadaceae bacterium]|nr:sigma-54-dependent Fis family transcriptional regulator [Pyrinomonadaceae bacterium]